MNNFFRGSLAVGLLLVFGLSGLPDRAQADQTALVMGFESVADWRTEADLLAEFAEDDLIASRTTTYAALAGGVELSTTHVKQGQYAVKWDEHPRFPSLTTTAVPADWSASNMLAFWVYSEVATDEKIWVAVHSDNAATAWRDYMLASFVIDWTGWRQIELPFSAFDVYQEPVGWTQVDGLSFFTKIFHQQPNPYTVLYLDDMRLLAVQAADLDRSHVVDMADYAGVAAYWGERIVRWEDFEGAQAGDDLGALGWISLYGADLADTVLVSAAPTGLAVSMAATGGGGGYRREFTPNAVTDTDAVFLAVDVAGGYWYPDARDVMAGFYAGFYPGVVVGLKGSAGELTWRPCVRAANNGAEYVTSQVTVQPGEIWQLRLQIDQTSGTGSLSVRNRSAGQATFTALTDVADVDLNLTSSTKPSTWKRFYLILDRAGQVDNLMLGVGANLPAPAGIWPDFNGDGVIDAIDLSLAAQAWLTESLEVTP